MKPGTVEPITVGSPRASVKASPSTFAKRAERRVSRIRGKVAASASQTWSGSAAISVPCSSTGGSESTGTSIARWVAASITGSEG